MIEIKNQKNYNSHVGRISLYVFIGAVISFILKPDFLIGEIFLLVIIEIIFLSEKFTDSVELLRNELIVTYFHFFKIKKLVFPIKETELKLSKMASLRTSAYLVLSILKNKKAVYKIDSLNGFNDDDLIKIKEHMDSMSLATD